MWIGNDSTINMRFKAAQTSFQIRDNYAFGYRISSINESNENNDFLIFIGLKKEEEQKKEVIEPQYKGTSEHDEVFKEINEKDILLILEKTPVPEGYKRRLVIVNNEVYLFKIYKREYLNSKIEEKRLFPLKEEVEDGSYLLEGYTPRLLLSYNKIILIDLLQKIESNKI